MNKDLSTLSNIVSSSKFADLNIEYSLRLSKLKNTSLVLLGLLLVLIMSCNSIAQASELINQSNASSTRNNRNSKDQYELRTVGTNELSIPKGLIDVKKNKAQEEQGVMGIINLIFSYTSDEKEQSSLEDKRNKVKISIYNPEIYKKALKGETASLNTYYKYEIIFTKYFENDEFKFVDEGYYKPLARKRYLMLLKSLEPKELLTSGESDEADMVKLEKNNVIRRLYHSKEQDQVIEKDQDGRVLKWNRFGYVYTKDSDVNSANDFLVCSKNRCRSALIYKNLPIIFQYDESKLDDFEDIKVAVTSVMDAIKISNKLDNKLDEAKKLEAQRKQ